MIASGYCHQYDFVVFEVTTAAVEEIVDVNNEQHATQPAAAAVVVPELVEQSGLISYGDYGIMKVRNDHIILISQVEVLIIFSSLVSNTLVLSSQKVTPIKMTTRFSQHFKEDSFVWDRGKWLLDLQHSKKLIHSIGEK